MNRPLLTAVAAVVLAVLALSACEGSHTTTTAAAKTHSASPFPASAAPASAALSAAPSSPPDPWQQWCFGNGFTDLETAIGDVSPVTTDASNGDYAALATDGTTLEKDAITAGANPPPGSPGQVSAYKSYMAWLSVAGGAYAHGQFSRAADAARQGTKYKPAVQAANDKCVAIGA